MLQKLFVTFVVVPLGVVLVVFAIANRHAVTVSLDPLGSPAPALSVTMPLFVLVIGLLALGVLLGSFATWRNQRRWRRAARQSQADLRDAQAERDALKAELKARDLSALPALPPPGSSF